MSPMLTALFATMLALYPIQAWLTYYGWAAWLVPVQTRRLAWWVMLGVSVASLAALFIAFQTTIAATSY